MAVFDLRGTHGSGKSYVAHKLLKVYGSKPCHYKGTTKTAYTLVAGLKPTLAILGDYSKVCGGCDGIKTQDEICNLVRELNVVYDNVLLEGALVGHTYTRYAQLATEIGRASYTFMFLDTPLEICIERVKARRLAKGNAKILDPKNIIRDHDTTQCRLPVKFREAGYTVAPIPFQDAPEAVMQLMGYPEETIRALHT